MKNKIVSIVLIFISFLMGFQLKGMMIESENAIGRVTGIGGVFFKSKNPKELRAWYKTNLGFHVNDYGAVFEWHQGADSTKKGFTQWSPFNETTKYFQPSTKEFMINYRVENLDQLMINLKKNKVEVVDSVESYEYGKFVHIMDLEGNKIELWEPNDMAYEKMGVDMKLETNY
ncbi:MAG: VOC family protein [Bacteroidota bacterium]